MKGKHAKNTANKQKLAKRMLALCFAVVFLCSCVLPVFATGSSLLTDALREAVEETAASTDTSTEAGGGTMMDDFQSMVSSSEYKTTYRFWLSQKDNYDLPDAAKTSASDLEGCDDFYAVAAIVNNTTLTAPEGFQNPTDPTDEGRTFEGWYYIDTYGLTQTFTFDDSPVLLDKSATIDVFAQWGEAPADDPADDADKAEGDTKADDTVKDDTKADDTVTDDTTTDDETVSDDDEQAEGAEVVAEETMKVAAARASVNLRGATISIVDSIKTNGRYTLKITKNRQNITDAVLNSGDYEIVWERDGSTVNQKWKDLAYGRVSNMADNGEWINVAYDMDSTSEDTKGRVYRVTIKDKASGNTIGSTSVTLEWNAALKNGSFEEPAIPKTSDGNDHYSGTVTGYFDGTGHPQVPQSVVPYWHTTEANGKIELGNVTIGRWKKSGRQWYWSYDTVADYNGVSKAADKEQFAELNAESESSLYQDVLTIPGATMYWSLSHRARQGNDTMYLIIAPATMVENISTDHGQVKTLVSQLSNGENQNYTYNGVTGTVYKYSFTADTKDWDYHTGQIMVPEGQFTTRFFFISGNTGSGYATVGNFLDAVSFSQETAPLPSGTAMINVTKNVYGLTLDEVRDNLSDKEFIVGKENVSFGRQDWRQAIDSDGTTYITATKAIRIDGITPGYNETYTFEENEKAKVLGYTMTTDPDDNHSASLNYDDSRGDVVFTNRYAKNTASVYITKKITGNIADLEQEFEFSISVEDESGNAVTNYTLWRSESELDSNETFILGNDETVEVKGLPIGAKVTVTETDPGEYTATAKLNEAKVENKNNSFEFTISEPTENERIELVVTNEKEIPVNTGVILDTLPYVLMLIAVGGGVVAFFLRKRHHDDEE